MDDRERLNELIGKKTWIASSDVYAGMARPHVELVCREWRGFHVEEADDSVYPIYRAKRYDCRKGTGVDEAVLYTNDMSMYANGYHGVEHCLDCLGHEQKADTDIGHWVCASRDNREEAISRCLEMWSEAMKRAEKGGVL